MRTLTYDYTPLDAYRLDADEITPLVAKVGHSAAASAASPSAAASPAAMPEFASVPHGGVTSAQGFSACGYAAGFRPATPDRLDLAIVTSQTPARCAGTFTTNKFCAASVTVCREHVQSGSAHAVVVNSGTANAATGPEGLENARAVAACAAEALGCAADDVLIASTGVIGVQLDMPRTTAAIKAAASLPSPDGGHQAACAILTTDTHPKEFAVSWTSADPAFAGTTFTLGGMAKGAGMIMPNMATMIAVLTTDAPLSAAACREALSSVVDDTFNKLVVDGDTSTNDTCLLLANGAAADDAAGEIEPGSVAFEECRSALMTVASTIARAMAADGEGATKLVTVKVTGAKDDAQADAAGRMVATSPLVKTAIFGHDANWGRIAASIGHSGVDMEQEHMSIRLAGLQLMRDGMPLPFSEDEALRRFEQDEIVIEADLGEGAGAATLWTCDLTYDYVKINGEYRS